MKCEICEEKISFFKCNVCERHICHDDYLIDKKICKVCEMSFCMICKSNLSIGSCEYCGRIICEDCTQYFDGARRICKECYRKRMTY